MRKWLVFLAVAGGIYLLYRIGGKKDANSPLGKKLKEAVSIIVWALLSVYVIAFLYWLYGQFFK